MWYLLFKISLLRRGTGKRLKGILRLGIKKNTIIFTAALAWGEFQSYLVSWLSVLVEWSPGPSLHYWTNWTANLFQTLIVTTRETFFKIKSQRYRGKLTFRWSYIIIIKGYQITTVKLVSKATLIKTTLTLNRNLYKTKKIKVKHKNQWQCFLNKNVLSSVLNVATLSSFLAYSWMVFDNWGAAVENARPA